MYVFKQCTLVLAVLVVALSTVASAGLGPTSPPPGLVGEAGQRMWARATAGAAKAADIAHELVPGSNRDCLEAVFLKVLAGYKIAASGEDGIEVRIEPSKKPAALDALARNRDDKCTGGGDGGATVEAMARFSLEHGEWDTSPQFRVEASEAVRYLYGRSAARLTPESPGVLHLLKLGILVPAAEGAAAAPAGVGLPIINPELFMPRKADPNQGT